MPAICEYLTDKKKDEVFYTCERDEHNSKVSDFFERTEDLYKEMIWQKNLRGKNSKLTRITLYNYDHAYQPF